MMNSFFCSNACIHVPKFRQFNPWEIDSGVGETRERGTYLVYCHEVFYLSPDQLCGDCRFGWTIDIRIQCALQWPFLHEIMQFLLAWGIIFFPVL